MAPEIATALSEIAVHGSSAKSPKMIVTKGLSVTPASSWTASEHRTRIRTMTQVLNVTDAKARLSELVAAVASTHDHVEITRNGEPAAVLMSMDELQALRETVAILSDVAAVADIREGQQDIAAGRLTDADDLRATMLKCRQGGE